MEEDRGGAALSNPPGKNKPGGGVGGKTPSRKVPGAIRAEIDPTYDLDKHRMMAVRHAARRASRRYYLKWVSPEQVLQHSQMIKQGQADRIGRGRGVDPIGLYALEHRGRLWCCVYDHRLGVVKTYLDHPDKFLGEIFSSASMWGERFNAQMASDEARIFEPKFNGF